MSTIEKALDKDDRAGPRQRKAEAAERAGDVADEASEATRSEADTAAQWSSERPGGRTPAHTRRVAELDLRALAAAGFVTPESVESPVAEQFRIIKRRLLLNAERTTGGNVVTVTSALAREGKTYVALNLAMIVAMELDRTALLIEGDVRKPDLCRTLRVEVSTGLTEFLSGPAERPLADFLVSTNLPRFTLLPAGQPDPHVPERFSSEAMKRLVEELAGRYSDRVVIFDSAPLLSGSGANVLAGLAGQVVMVVEAIRTPQRALKEALGLLDRSDNVGLVLNKSREHRPTRYHYGYYAG